MQDEFQMSAFAPFPAVLARGAVVGQIVRSSPVGGER